MEKIYFKTIKYKKQEDKVAKLFSLELDSGHDLYCYAAGTGNIEIMEHLQKTYNWKIEIDAFHTAVVEEQIEILEYLSNLPFFDVTRKNEDGYDAYLIAAENGKLEIMKYLEETHNWDITTVTAIKDNCYLLAAYKGHLDIMKHIESKNNSKIIQHKDEEGHDAYLSAVLGSHFKIIKHLENDMNWDIYIRNSSSQNAYEIAKENIKNDSIIRHLFKSKFDFRTFNEKVNANDACQICHDDFSENKIICKCINNHNIHRDCYLQYLFESDIDKENIECIYCRDKMINCSFIYNK